MKTKIISLGVTIVFLGGAFLTPLVARAEITDFLNPRVVYVAHKSVVLGVTVNDANVNSSRFHVELGTTSGTYPTRLDGGNFTNYPDSESYYLVSEVEDVLLPSTIYYAHFVSDDDDTVVSAELTFTTYAAGELKIDSVSPAEGPVGTLVTIKGRGFGTTLTGGVVYFGNCSIERQKGGCADIVSWSDTEIVARVIGSETALNHSASGPVGIRKELTTSGSAIAERLVLALEGPTFTVTAPTTNTNQSATNTATDNTNAANTNVANTNTAPTNVNAIATSAAPTPSDNQTLAYALAAAAFVLLIILIVLRAKKPEPKV